MALAPRLRWPRLNWLGLTLWPSAILLAGVALIEVAHPAVGFHHLSELRRAHRLQVLVAVDLQVEILAAAAEQYRSEGESQLPGLAADGERDEDGAREVERGDCLDDGRRQVVAADPEDLQQVGAGEEFGVVLGARVAQLGTHTVPVGEAVRDHVGDRRVREDDQQGERREQEEPGGGPAPQTCRARSGGRSRRGRPRGRLDGREIPVLLVEKAADGFASLWLDSPDTPWESDQACARAAATRLGCEVRCSLGGWQPGDDPDRFLQVLPDGSEREIDWPDSGQ